MRWQLLQAQAHAHDGLHSRGGGPRRTSSLFSSSSPLSSVVALTLPGSRAGRPLPHRAQQPFSVSRLRLRRPTACVGRSSPSRSREQDELADLDSSAARSRLHPHRPPHPRQHPHAPSGRPPAAQGAPYPASDRLVPVPAADLVRQPRLRFCHARRTSTLSHSLLLTSRD